MISKKMLSPLFIAAGLVAFPALSANADGAIVAPTRAEAPSKKPNAANPLGAYSKVNPLEPSPG
jgi:hypothetical protein